MITPINCGLCKQQHVLGVLQHAVLLVLELRLWFTAEEYHKCDYHVSSLHMGVDYNNSRLFNITVYGFYNAV